MSYNLNFSIVSNLSRTHDSPIVQLKTKFTDNEVDFL